MIAEIVISPGLEEHLALRLLRTVLMWLLEQRVAEGRFLAFGHDRYLHGCFLV